MKWLGFAVPLALAVAPACVGGDPVSANGTGSSSSSGNPDTTIEDASTLPCDGGACSPTDAAATCEAPKQRCGEACVSLASDPRHCGTCDRSCGDVGCKLGRCEPDRMLSGAIEHFELAANAVYLQRGKSLLECPLGSSCDAPRDILTMPQSRSLHGFALDGTRVLFLEQSGVDINGTALLRACTLADCNAPVTLDELGGSRPLGMALGPTHAVWLAEIGAAGNPSIRAVPRAGGGAFAIGSPASNHSLAPRLAVGPGFAVYQYTDNAQERHLASTALGAGSAPSTSVAAELTRLHVVAGVPWALTRPTAQSSALTRYAVDLANEQAVLSDPSRLADFAVRDDTLFTLSESTREVRRCNVADCSNTGVVLAVDQNGLREIAVDATHVYWSTTSGLYRTTY